MGSLMGAGEKGCWLKLSGSKSCNRLVVQQPARHSMNAISAKLRTVWPNHLPVAIAGQPETEITCYALRTQCTSREQPYQASTELPKLTRFALSPRSFAERSRRIWTRVENRWNNSLRRPDYRRWYRPQIVLKTFNGPLKL